MQSIFKLEAEEEKLRKQEEEVAHQQELQQKQLREKMDK